MVSNSSALPPLVQNPNESDIPGRGNSSTSKQKSRMGFKNWKRRVSEKAIQKMGLASANQDKNTGNIDIQLKNFELLKSRLTDVQNHIGNYIQSVESNFGAAQACLSTGFLHTPLRGDMARQVKESICKASVQGTVIRGLNEFLLEPLGVVFEFCNTVDEMLKHRTSLLLDYDHHKRKFDSASQKISELLANRKASTV